MIVMAAIEPAKGISDKGIERLKQLSGTGEYLVKGTTIFGNYYDGCWCWFVYAKAKRISQ